MSTLSISFLSSCNNVSASCIKDVNREEGDEQINLELNPFLRQMKPLQQCFHMSFSIVRKYNQEFLLINSSNWQCFRIKALCRVPHRKHTKGNRQILVVGKRLKLGVRGPEEKPTWRETRSSGTGGSHPGQESWSVSGGEAHIPQSLGTKGNHEGWPSWVEYRSGGTGDPHLGVDIFPNLSPKAKPYCG